MKNGDKVFLSYAVDDQRISDSTLARKGHFTFTGPLDYPVDARIFLGKNPYVTLLAKGEKIDYFRLYLEPVVMTLQAKDSLKNIRISGSPANQEQAELRAMLVENEKQYATNIQYYQSLTPEKQQEEEVVAAYKAYKEKGFEVLGVSLDNPGKRDAWLKAIKEDELTWTQVSDLRGWENAATKIYGVRSIPLNFLIDPAGKIWRRIFAGKFC